MVRQQTKIHHSQAMNAIHISVIIRAALLIGCNVMGLVYVLFIFTL